MVLQPTCKIYCFVMVSFYIFIAILLARHKKGRNPQVYIIEILVAIFYCELAYYNP